MHCRSLTVFLVSLLLTSLTRAAGATEELIATQNEPSKPFAAEGGGQIAWRERHGRMWRMAVNGAPGQDYANVGLPVFRPDGSRLAYTAQKTAGSTETIVVHDGQESPPFDQVAWLQFTTDGKHIAYMGAEGANYRPYLDDRPLESAPVIAGSAGLWVNADGSRWAYWREEGIVVDGKLRPEHKSRSGGQRIDTVPRFSADGRRLAYRVAQGVKAIVVVDDKESPAYDSATDPVFSADGKHVGFFAIKDRRAFAVIDGIDGPPLYKVIGSFVVFSPDSSRFAYFGMPQNVAYWWLPAGANLRQISGLFLMGGKLDDVAAGLKADPFYLLPARTENLLGPFFSVDAAHWAFPRPDGAGMVIVTDTSTSPKYEAVAQLAIDREGRAIFAARKGASWIAMRGAGAISQPLDEISAILLSPDGSRAIWVGRRGGKHLVLGTAGDGKAYDAVFAPTFTANGTAVQYIAKDGNRFLRVTQPVEP